MAEQASDRIGRKGDNMASYREDGTIRSSKNTEYDYLLRYIEESIDNRSTLVEVTTRAIQAYRGLPSRDGYIGAVERYSDAFAGEDADRAAEIKRRCETIRPRKSMVISKAIDSMVAQAMGGVGQYECAPYDPHFVKSSELIDLLDEAAMNFYEDNHIDALIPQALEFAGLSGATYAHLSYKKTANSKGGKVGIDLVPSTEMLIDPLRSKRNRDRFIGFHQPKSWADLKHHIKYNNKLEQWELESLNEVDTYLLKVEAYINKHAGRFSSIFKPGNKDNLPTGLDQFYKASALTWAERNADYLRTRPQGLKEDDPMRYRANDVEVSYVYDLDNHIQFTVVNRMYIIRADHNYLKNTLEYEYPLVDPHSGNSVPQSGKKVVTLDHPFVPLEYKRSLWQTYPYSPIIDVLDLFDDICALESLIYHTISIMTPITFTGNPKDIEKLGTIAGVSGETIKGFIANSVTVLNKSVDLSPALTQITRLEMEIADKLNGVDVREQSKMVGDRATAAEAMGVASLVAQGLNSLIANVEVFAEELMAKVFKLTVIYEDEGFGYNFTRNDKLYSVSRQELAGEMRIRARLKSKIKAEQQSQAANTMQWFVPLMGSDSIKDKEAFAQSIVPTLAQGFSRKTISSWFKESPEQQALIQAQIDAARAQEGAAQAEAERNRGIDFRYVDPSAGGAIGAADIAGALGGNAMNMEDSPVGGANKPGPTSRKLGYGIGAGGQDEPLGFPVDELMEPAPDRFDEDDEDENEAAERLALEAGLSDDSVYSVGPGTSQPPFSASEGSNDNFAPASTAGGGSNAPLRLSQNPTTGGRGANDWLNGANSPYTTGVGL